MLSVLVVNGRDLLGTLLAAVRLLVEVGPEVARTQVGVDGLRLQVVVAGLDLTHAVVGQVKFVAELVQLVGHVALPRLLGLELVLQVVDFQALVVEHLLVVALGAPVVVVELALDQFFFQLVDLAFRINLEQHQFLELRAQVVVLLLQI